MSDCNELEIRDLLPELMHGRLGGATRARVEEHLFSCADCAAELSALMAVRTALSRAPVIDTAAIVRALPRPPVPEALAVAGGLTLERGSAPAKRAAVDPRRRRSVIWQIAAGIMFVSAGGLSLSIADTYFSNDKGESVVGDAAEITAQPTTPIAARPDTVAGSRTSAARSTAAALSFGGGVGDLDTADLESLLGALESLEAAPSADPDSGNGASGVGTVTGEGGN